MDSLGLAHVQIVAADDEEDWGIVESLHEDSQLFRDVAIIGVHYPGTKSPKEAKELKKPLWASEDWSTYANWIGGGCWARILNQNYVCSLAPALIH